MSSRSFAHASHCRQVGLELRLGLVERCRVAVGAHVSGLAEDAVQRPEPAHAVRPAALFVDAPHGPLAAVDGEVLPVLVDPGAEAGRTNLDADGPAAALPVLEPPKRKPNRLMMEVDTAIGPQERKPRKRVPSPASS